MAFFFFGYKMIVNKGEGLWETFVDFPYKVS